LFEKFTAPPFSLESNFNDAIFVPYRTIQTMLNSTPGIYEILTQTKPDTDHKALVATLDTKLRTAHGGAKDFAIGGEGADNGSSDQTLNLLTMMTIGMAFVAFIVGGVGIMNVMLVSVTERIHEIGLRKAIGATNRQILNQFIAEAFVLSLFGAVAGVVGSVFTIYLLRFFTNLQPVFVWQVMVSVPLVAIATGVLFGSFPAFKAAQKDPIEALRHE
jgi:ABC-type antimicrobial peptide transport system permease subunit